MSFTRLRVLVLDNYDSFTYNLVQYLGELGAAVEVVRNDHATIDELLVRGYDRVIVSPGPCTPNEAGISLEAVKRFPAAHVPTLGVCLGHQALVQAWGGQVIKHEPISAPLLTATNNVNSGGVIGTEGTQVVVGNKPFDFGLASGLRVTTGLWDCDHRWAFELSAS